MADPNRPKRRTHVKAMRIMLGNRYHFLTIAYSKEHNLLSYNFCGKNRPNSPQIQARKVADSSIKPWSVVPGSRLCNCVRPTDWTYIRAAPKVTSIFCNSSQEIRKQLLCVTGHCGQDRVLIETTNNARRTRVCERYRIFKV